MRSPRPCPHCGVVFVPRHQEKCCGPACVHARRSAQAKAQWLRPEYRTLMTEQARATMQRAWTREDYRAKVQARMLRRWADPDYRMVMSAVSRARWAATKP